MNRFGIIQLSDLQFGEKHRFGNPSKISERLLNDIKKLSGEGEYDFIPRYIVLSGDITEKAHAREFKVAVGVIEEILSGLNIDRMNILCIPGNHDVNWNLSKYSQEAGDDQLKFLPYNNFVSTITNNKNYSISDCYPRIIDDRLDFGLEFLLLNSCEKEDHSNHEGYVCPEKLKKTLPSQVPKGYERLKIAILHHRLDTSVNDVRSAIENANDIESIIVCHKYNIVLTGHIHLGLCHAVNSGSHNTIFAGCGSTGVDKTQREDGIQNQYCIHIIDLDKNEFQSVWRAYNPTLKTEYGSGGWTKDNSFNEEPEKYKLPDIKRIKTIEPGLMKTLSTSKEDDIYSKSTADNNIEKTPKKGIDMKTSDQKKIDWNNIKFANELAIAILLGGWDEN